VEGHSLISSDVLATYAADAAREVSGVLHLSESPLHRSRGVRVVEQDGAVSVEIHLAVAWGENGPEVGAAVQRSVVDYLQRMADVTPGSVDVVVDEIGAPPDAG
jgi:uncharacterized alkaline shock family protein YloU